MSDLYAITETLLETGAVTLYREACLKDNRPVLLKTLNAGPREADRLKHEYEILHQPDSSFVLKPVELERQQTMETCTNYEHMGIEIITVEQL